MLLDLWVGLNVNFDEVIGFADLLGLHGTRKITVVVSFDLVQEYELGDTDGVAPCPTVYH